MGYYTNYKLVIKPSGICDPILKRLRKENENAEYALEEDGTTSENCKWYNHEEEMLKFSMKYPGAVFILYGEGEDAGDIWKTVFKNGRYESLRAEVVFPEPSGDFTPDVEGVILQLQEEAQSAEEIDKQNRRREVEQKRAKLHDDIISLQKELNNLNID